MIICSICAQEKSAAEFYPRTNYCRPCKQKLNKEYMRAKRLAAKSKAAPIPLEPATPQIKLSWKARHKAELAAYGKRWRNKNQKKIKQYRIQYVKCPKF